MIVLHPEGGLCNKILAISSAMKLSLEKGHRLVVAWIPDMHMVERFDDLFEPVDEFLLIQTFRGGGRIYNGIVKHILGAIFSEWNPFATTFRSKEKFLKDVGEKKFLMHSDFCEFCKGADYTWFRPRKEIQQRIDAEISLVKGAIGMHIRRTDHKQAMACSPLALFYDRIEYEVKANPLVKIFLCSDDPAVKADIKQRYPRNVVIRENVLGRFDRGGVADGIVDLWLLSKCKRIYGTYPSSFSLVASKIGNIELEWVRSGVNHV